jgi:hypothetical protein
MNNKSAPNEREIARRLEELERKSEQLHERLKKREQEFEDAQSMPTTLRPPPAFPDEDDHLPGQG